MVRKTEKEYETIEKEIEVPYCDVCGMDYNDNEIAHVVVNPELERVRSSEENMFILRRARMFARDGNYEQLEHALSNLDSVPPGTLSTDASLDVCHGCVETNLGVEDIPSQETDFHSDGASKPDETGMQAKGGSYIPEFNNIFAWPTIVFTLFSSAIMGASVLGLPLPALAGALGSLSVILGMISVIMFILFSL